MFINLLFINVLNLYQFTQLHIYNAKCESIKDYKYFFYQYSEFHVFTRQ